MDPFREFGDHHPGRSSQTSSTGFLSRIFGDDHILVHVSTFFADAFQANKFTKRLYKSLWPVFLAVFVVTLVFILTYWFVSFLDWCFFRRRGIFPNKHSDRILHVEEYRDADFGEQHKISRLVRD
ncbi:unnamed protein product, partial [Amoebophrya sp. A120]|eukprot:GSA120T00022717001.1